MSQCVPNWELEDPPNSSHGLPLNTSSAATAAVTSIVGSRSDYEVAELTWVNGHPSMNGLGQLRIEKPVPKYPSSTSWEKTVTGSGTLESVVDQATGAILFPTSQSPTTTDYDLVPWIISNARRSCNSAAEAAVTVMDAMVPCSNRNILVEDPSTRVPEQEAGLQPPPSLSRKQARDGNCSVSGSATSMGPPFDTYGVNGVGDDLGFTTSTSPLDCSPDTENTSCGRAVTVVDELDSASHSRRSQRDGGCVVEEKRKGGGGEVLRSSISTKRSRAAAVHNQSERKRRDRINQRMKTLQKLVPNSSKTDKASMLDEVIDYLKQLQAQVQMMNRMNSIPHMMMPMPLQQLQMAMMAQMAQMAHMGMNMGMAMGLDMNPLARPQPQTQPPTVTQQPVNILQPSAFLPFVGASAWDVTGDRMQPPAGPAQPTDPFSAFMAACQAPKPMNMDVFNRMNAMYQQVYQQPPQTNPSPK